MTYTYIIADEPHNWDTLWPRTDQDQLWDQFLDNL